MGGNGARTRLAPAAPKDPVHEEAMADKFCVLTSDNKGCYLCRQNSRELFLMRHIDSGQLRALCSGCALRHLDAYLIDNTRPWPCLAAAPVVDAAPET